MSPENPSPSRNVDVDVDVGLELSVLIKTLRETDRRIVELTAGEVDAVVGREGRSLVLQDQFRHSETGRQAAILDALPAQIALLDDQGFILSVNKAWRCFADANALGEPDYAIGRNYLEVCDHAQQCGAVGGRPVADGIRAVLSGQIRRFSHEYLCPSATQKRWFLLVVTPLFEDRSGGAVAMHIDVTAQREAEEGLHLGESMFRQVADNVRDVFFLIDVGTHHIVYASPAYEEIWGRKREHLYANPETFADALHPDDRALTMKKSEEAILTGYFEIDHRIVRPDGSIRWIEARCFPVRDFAGHVVRHAVVAKDITQSKQSTLELFESERRFGELLRHVKLATIVLDRQARITFCNDYLLRLTGWQLDEVIGQNFFTLFMSVNNNEESDYFAKRLDEASDPWHREIEIRTRSGELRLIRWNNLVLRSSAGEVIGLASIGDDITERRQERQRVLQLNRVHAVLSGITGLTVHASNREELFGQACRIAVDAGGFSLAVIGITATNTTNIVPVAIEGRDEGAVTAFKAILSATVGAPRTLAARAIREKRAIVSNDSKNDPQVSFRERQDEFGCRSVATLPLIVADEAVGVLMLCADQRDFFHEKELKLLTELSGNIAFAMDHIAKGEQLKFVAFYDAVTGLANRSLFLERVAQYLRSAVSGGNKIAVFVVDIERFRNVNDTLGRPAGDELLRQVAQWLTGVAGDASLLARLDADHFAVVVPEVRQGGDIARLVESSMEAFLSHPFRLNDTEFRIAAKVGVALFPDDGGDAETLVRNAEASLKKAKVSGDRYLFYAQKMTETIAGRLNLENQLRHALGRGEFVLHYQPKVLLVSGELRGVEALIRWNDPLTGSLVSPNRFIPILEETGLIYEVGRWALRTAIDDYLRWCKAGLAAVRIAVNVSPLQLRHASFIDDIKRRVSIDPRAAAGLELEITESVIMRDVKLSITSLKAIRAMGVHVAIDDFGTGFSSLSHLAKLPVDTLKIDRSFVNDMTGGPEGLALVSTIIQLAHSLKLNVVAEGVETEEQSRLLRLLGCDEMQGYLISKPVPGDLFAAKFLAAPAAR